jgi:hypothetical protein
VKEREDIMDAVAAHHETGTYSVALKRDQGNPDIRTVYLDLSPSVGKNSAPVCAVVMRLPENLGRDHDRDFFGRLGALVDDLAHQDEAQQVSTD